MWDVLIRGGTVYDGTGAAGIRADVALAGDRIVAVGQLAGEAGTVIEAGELAVAPGFIDAHSHDDLAVFDFPEMDFKVMQGVTTNVVGNCGLGVAPYEAGVSRFRAFEMGGDVPRWKGYGGYLEAIDRDPPSINTAVLVGHGTLRHAAMGNAERPSTPDELARMRAWLREGLEAGAVGLSTGLIYEPGRYAETDEIVTLAKELAEIGGLYASHMRNEAGALLDAVRETIHIGEAAGVPVQISHHKASGRENWGKVRESLRLIEAARAGGVDVTADQYPYTAGSTGLYAVVQNNALNPLGASGGIGRLEPANVLFATTPRHPEWEGKTLQDLCDAFDLPAEEAARRVLEAEDSRVVVVLEMMDEADVRTVLRHPTTMIGSDGIPTRGANPHPRLYGCFPRVLGRYARDEGVLPLHEAIHRMTGMPAAKFRLAGRGVIRPGAFADLVLFDPAAIADTATYAAPRRYPSGISHIFVNGTHVVCDGVHTGARPGRALRRSEGRQ